MSSCAGGSSNLDVFRPLSFPCQFLSSSAAAAELHVQLATPSRSSRRVLQPWERWCAEADDVKEVARSKCVGEGHAQALGLLVAIFAEPDEKCCEMARWWCGLRRI